MEALKPYSELVAPWEHNPLGQIHSNECKEYPLEGYHSASCVKSIFETRHRTIWVGTVSGLQKRPLNLPDDARFEKIPEIGAPCAR